MLPKTFLLCLEIQISNENTSFGIVRGWVCNGVDTDVAVKENNAVEF